MIGREKVVIYSVFLLKFGLFKATVAQFPRRILLDFFFLIFFGQ